MFFAWINNDQKVMFACIEPVSEQAKEERILQLSKGFAIEGLQGLRYNEGKLDSTVSFLS